MNGGTVLMSFRPWFSDSKVFKHEGRQARVAFIHFHNSYIF